MNVMLARQTINLARCWGYRLASALSSHSHFSGGDTCYLVSISSPFRGSRDKGLCLAEKFEYKGKFHVVSCDIYLWHFVNSIPASEATMNDFSLDMNVSASNDVILPPSPKAYIPELSFKLVRRQDAICHLKLLQEEFHQLHGAREGQKGAVPVDELVEEVLAGVPKPDVHDMESCEVMANILLAKQIDRVAKNWG